MLPTRHQTCACAVGIQSLNHWAPRAVPPSNLLTGSLISRKMGKLTRFQQSLMPVIHHKLIKNRFKNLKVMIHAC